MLTTRPSTPGSPPCRDFEVISDNDDRLGPFLVLVWQVEAEVHRLAKEAERVGTHFRGEACVPAGVRYRSALNEVCWKQARPKTISPARASLRDPGRSQARIWLRHIARGDDHDPIRSSPRAAADQHGNDKRENRGIDADTESERDDGDQRVLPVFYEHPRGEGWSCNKDDSGCVEHVPAVLTICGLDRMRVLKFHWVRDQLTWPLLPPSYERNLGHARRIELAADRRIRERNKVSAGWHWPIWIWVFFIAPGPLTFNLFAHGFDIRMAAWLGLGRCTAPASRRGGEAAWRRATSLHHPLHGGSSQSALSQDLLHARLERSDRVCRSERRGPRLRDRLRGSWRLRQIYDAAYFPIVVTIWLLGAFRVLPPRQTFDGWRRARAALFLRIGLGRVRRPAVLWVFWKILPPARW